MPLEEKEIGACKSESLRCAWQKTTSVYYGIQGGLPYLPQVFWQLISFNRIVMEKLNNSDFRPLLMKDRLNISEISLKGP